VLGGVEPASALLHVAMTLSRALWRHQDTLASDSFLTSEFCVLRSEFAPPNTASARILTMRKALLLLALLAAPTLHAQAVLCESVNGTYRECRVGSAGVITLVTELSERLCFEGATWGTQQGGIVWVDRGCRATFTTGDGSMRARGKHRIACESAKGFMHVCSADVSHGVAIAQQLSEAACIKGESWDFNLERNEIWVDHGCRAEFALGVFTETTRPTTRLDDPVTCASKSGKRTDCVADTSAGVQMVKQTSEAECNYGREWGYDAKGIWVNKGCSADFVVKGKPKPVIRAVACASTAGARNHCDAITTYGVALARQLDEHACILGQSWGFDATGVWVSGNCNAMFALGGYRIPATAVPPTASHITCESLDGSRVQCPAITDRGVGLITQLGENDCVLNRNWGYNAEGIWVSGGCRAEFAVAK
jgi:ribosomal protein L37AE/L43A